ncbi:MAG: hypothetical protein P8Z37_05915 [Acidobacteriota bacterium]
MISVRKYNFLSKWPGWILHLCRVRLSNRCFPHVLLFLIFVSNIMAAPVYALEQTPDRLDPEHITERLRQDVALTRPQTEAIRPMAADLCRSLRGIRSRNEKGETTAAIDIEKETEASIMTFRDSVSAHLSPAQRISLKEVLEKWKHEIVADIVDNSPSSEFEQGFARTQLGWSVNAPGFGESPGSAAIDLARLESPETTAQDGTDIRSARGEWAVAPYPLVDPTIGNGAVFISAYIRPLSTKDKVSPPSVFGAGGMITSSKSWAAAYGQKLYFMEDRFRILGVFGLADVNYDFSVTDDDTGNKYQIPIHQKGYGFVAGGQVRAYGGSRTLNPGHCRLRAQSSN